MASVADAQADVATPVATPVAATVQPTGQAPGAKPTKKKVSKRVVRTKSENLKTGAEASSVTTVTKSTEVIKDPVAKSKSAVPVGDVKTETTTRTTKSDEGEAAGDPRAVVTETTTETVTTVKKPGLTERTKETVHTVSKGVESVISNGGDRREASRLSLMVQYSPLDLVIPSKIGGSLGYVESRAFVDELEYLGSSISAPWFVTDIGSFSDKRISFIRRSFSDRNSFNVHYGLSYFDLQAHVGSRYLSSATNAPSNVDLLASRSLGFNVGIGNRWTFPSGLTIGIDWISWAQPLIVIDKSSDLINYVQNRDDKQTLENALNVVSYCPRLSVLKLAFGWVF